VRIRSSPDLDRVGVFGDTAAFSSLGTAHRAALTTGSLILKLGAPMRESETVEGGTQSRVLRRQNIRSTLGVTLCEECRIRAAAARSYQLG
jgi:hypothetical protein